MSSPSLEGTKLHDRRHLRAELKGDWGPLEGPSMFGLHDGLSRKTGRGGGLSVT